MKIDSVFAVSPMSFPEIQSKIFPAENERAIVTASEIPTKGERVPSEYRLAPIARGPECSCHLLDITGEVVLAELLTPDL